MTALFTGFVRCAELETVGGGVGEITDGPPAVEHLLTDVKACRVCAPFLVFFLCSADIVVVCMMT